MRGWFYESSASLLDSLRLIPAAVISNEFVSKVELEQGDSKRPSLLCYCSTISPLLYLAQLLSWICMDELMEQVLPRVYCTWKRSRNDLQKGFLGTPNRFVV